MADFVKIDVFEFDTFLILAFSQRNLINLGVEVHLQMP